MKTYHHPINVVRRVLFVLLFSLGFLVHTNLASAQAANQTKAVCGNGVIESGEACDPAAVPSGAGAHAVCVNSCTSYACESGYSYNGTKECQATDQDKDGTPQVNGDCDDTNAAIYPGATEVCDGKDNDCDGQIDDGVGSTWYQDSDNDGYGNPVVTTQTCSQPTNGYVSNASDCDDTTAQINPQVSEFCDGIDNDCDGSIDEGIAGSFWYKDSDNDGVGDDCNDRVQDCRPNGDYDQKTCGDCDGTDPDAWQLTYTVSKDVQVCTDGGSFCGDGQVDEGEQCDDGNKSVGDGCDASCQSEYVAACPNGKVDQGEECDDGNQVDADACRNHCVNAFCGDKIINNGEECDGEPTVANANCSTETCENFCNADFTMDAQGNCIPNQVCGNGKQEGNEQCDDGNTTAADGCSSGCQMEKKCPGADGTYVFIFPDTAACPVACRNGILESGEQCDGVATVANATCSTETCQNVCDEGYTMDSAGNCVANPVEEVEESVAEFTCPAETPTLASIVCAKTSEFCSSSGTVQESMISDFDYVSDSQMMFVATPANGVKGFDHDANETEVLGFDQSGAIVKIVASSTDLNILDDQNVLSDYKLSVTEAQDPVPYSSLDSSIVIVDMAELNGMVYMLTTENKILAIMTDQTGMKPSPYPSEYYDFTAALQQHQLENFKIASLKSVQQDGNDFLLLSFSDTDTVLGLNLKAQKTSVKSCVLASVAAPVTESTDDSLQDEESETTAGTTAEEVTEEVTEGEKETTVEGTTEAGGSSDSAESAQPVSGGTNNQLQVADGATEAEAAVPEEPVQQEAQTSLSIGGHALGGGAMCSLHDTVTKGHPVNAFLTLIGLVSFAVLVLVRQISVRK